MSEIGKPKEQARPPKRFRCEEAPPDHPVYRRGWIVGSTRAPAASRPAVPQEPDNKDKEQK